MLEKTSIRNVSKLNPRSGDTSKLKSGGIIPLKSRKYGSVIFPKDENGWA